MKTTCADQQPNKKMATRDAVGSGIVPAFVSADQLAPPRLTNAWAAPLPNGGVPRPDIPPQKTTFASETNKQKPPTVGNKKLLPF